MDGIRQWRLRAKTNQRTSESFYVQAQSADSASDHFCRHILPGWLLPDEELINLHVQEVADSVVMEALGVRPLFDLGSKDAN